MGSATDSHDSDDDFDMSLPGNSVSPGPSRREVSVTASIYGYILNINIFRSPNRGIFSYCHSILMRIFHCERYWLRHILRVLFFLVI